MTDSEREQVALFRYGLIAPLLNGHENTTEYLSRVCSQAYDVPYYGRKEFAPKTVLCWLRAYRRLGFQALLPRKRSDKGKSRVLEEEKIEKILQFRQQHRDSSVTLCYERLIRDSIIAPDDASYYTVYRLLKENKLIVPEDKNPKERKRFSHDQINVLWQGDMSVGPYLNIGGRKLKTNLFTFIDDCSRLVPFAQFFFNEKFEAMTTVLKESIIRRGIPKIIYVDNGKVYHASTLHLACAQLGVTLSHTKPYDPESKGKIERFFGTVRRRFYPSLAENPVSSIEELNKRFWKWLEEDYHRKIHSGIDMAPLDKFMSQIHTVKTIQDPQSLEPMFWKRDYRKVHNDGTISVNNTLYEVPLKFVGERIEIRYDHLASETVHIFENNQSVYSTTPVSFVENAKAKRKGDNSEKAISFGELFSQSKGGEA